MAESTEPVYNISNEDIESAFNSWNNTSADEFLHLKEVKHPILPENGKKNILVTSALPYCNNTPHLGNIIGSTLSADVFTRYCRIKGTNVLYICGTDEYGTTTEAKALEEGVTCEEICKKYYKEHKGVYDWFNIDFDYFGRTSTQQQTEISQDIFNKLNANGYIIPDTVEQLYCENCKKFLADRFVEGICPFCAFNDARGDQCDKCGKLINAIELKSPKCKTCSHTPVIKSSNHLFLDLPKLQPSLEQWIDKTIDKNDWTNSARVITRSWIKDGLKPRCITRDLKWGTKVPLAGYEDKVFYVWFDAPIGYISITANYTDQWQKWWKAPESVQYYQFMAKDNVPFHSVIFPSCLLGTNDGYTLVNHLSGIDYLNYEDGKFSKSRGIGVFGDQARSTGIESDIYRFYLLYVRPESQDSKFSWDDMTMKNNSELLNNLGNFANRALSLCDKNLNATIPNMVLTADDKLVIAKVNREITEYIENMERIKLRDSIRNILNISRIGNQYMQTKQPWVLLKGSDEEKAQGGTVIGVAANIVYLLSILLYPYMPTFSTVIRKQLNVSDTEAQLLEKLDINSGSKPYPQLPDKLYCFLKSGHKIGKPEPLFKRIKEEDVKVLKTKFSGKQESGDAAATADAAAGTNDKKKGGKGGKGGEKGEKKKEKTKPNDAEKPKQDGDAKPAASEQAKTENA